jgi:cytochrome c oxidase assembly factor 6
MGLFGLFAASDADKRATEVRTGAVAPSRAERKQCWLARDAYFACLDANNIVDALKDDKAAAKACGAESAGFEKDCATQWVGFFSFLLLVFSLGSVDAVGCVGWVADQGIVGHILQEVAGAGYSKEGEVEGARGPGGQQNGCGNRFRAPVVIAGVGCLDGSEACETARRSVEYGIVLICLLIHVLLGV